MATHFQRTHDQHPSPSTVFDVFLISTPLHLNLAKWCVCRDPSHGTAEAVGRPSWPRRCAMAGCGVSWRGAARARELVEISSLPYGHADSILSCSLALRSSLDYSPLPVMLRTPSLPVLLVLLSCSSDRPPGRYATSFSPYTTLRSSWRRSAASSLVTTHPSLATALLSSRTPYHSPPTPPAALPSCLPSIRDDLDPLPPAV